jgi:histidinol-phosphate/aromatic aminotransferase/cobyric acid decarboxylase-like protein
LAAFVTNAALRRYLAGWRSPNAVGSASLGFLEACIADIDLIDDAVRGLVRTRSWLSEALCLAHPGWSVAESAANFVLVNVGSQAAVERVVERLREHGIVVRAFEVGHPFATSVRITVAERSLMQRVLDLLEDVR